MGTLKFYATPASGGTDVWVVPASDQDGTVVLNLTEIESDQSFAATMTIPPSSDPINITAEFFSASDGSVSVTKPERSSRGLGGPNLKTLTTFLNKGVSLGQTFMIATALAGQFKGKIGKDEKGLYKFSLGFTKPITEVSGRVTATSPQGSSSTIEFKKKPLGEGEIDIYFPAGTNLEPCVSWASIEIDVSNALFDEIIAESRAKTRHIKH
ncbi:MAG: hypothetical protein JSS39_13385 [Nitrospira sp.]|nr:hypothetical protein [Nitrospira sp.]